MSNPFTIVLDAGHGGTEKIGGSSPNNAVGANNLLEKDLTLDIARRTAQVLQTEARVILTRNEDKNLSLAKRAAIAGVNNASVFLSIHFNGFSDKNIDGTETFTATKANPLSEKLARNVQNNLVNVTQVANRGVKRADLGVLLPERHLPQTAACLAEIAFLTNPKQAKQLEDAAYRQQIAVALGDAILKSLPSNAPAVVPQSFSFDDTENLDARYFQPLDTAALGGNPVFDIGESVGKGGANKEDDVYAVKKRLISLGYDWITLDKKIDNTTIAAIKLFQTIIAGHNSISGDGKISVGKNTHLWLQAVNAPRWQTMPAGSAAEGFFNFELTDLKDTHDFGTDWIAETIKSAGAHYRDNYLNTHAGAVLLTVNDVSLARGGNTPDHDGHEAGLACDLQLPRTDGKAGLITHADALYDRSAARAMIKALRAQGAVAKVFFNDQTLIDEGLCNRLAGHDDHIHFEINAPARGAVETDGIFNYHYGNRLYQGSYQDDIDYQTHALDTACNNAKGIAKNQTFAEFKDMNIKSDLPSRTEKNVCLRWNDIPANICEIDVVVHFHGYDIDENWKKGSVFEYVEKISGLRLDKRNGRPTLCILPFGRPFKMTKPEDKRIGYDFPFITGNKDGLQRLIAFALNEVGKSASVNLKVGRLILTAHSGGGAALAEVLSFKKYPVKEVHLFDAIYAAQYDPVIVWAKERIAEDAKHSKDGKPMEGALRVIYVNTKSTEIKSALSRLTPPLSRFYRVEHTDFDHREVPKLFGPELLGDAGADLNLEQPKAKQKSLAYYDEAEIDYFARSEPNYMNY